MEASEAPSADPSELPAAEPCPEEETLPAPSSDAQPLTTPPAPSPVALSVSLTPATASAPIPPSQPQSQLSQQQRPPVSAKTRPQNHLGQPPLTPLSSAPPSSSSSYPTIQRSGLAMGVPALLPHHTRQPSQVGYSLGSSHFSQPFMNSSSPSSSFSQPFSGYPRGSMSLSEQSSGSVVPSPPFSQPFSAMPRSTAGMPEQQSNSNSQLKPPVPGVQTIGMIGSLSGSSRMRAGGIQHQQRLGQPIDKSIPQSGTNQSQKFPNPGLSRPTSMPSANAPISALQTAQSLQQQWMPNPGKQSHGTSFPSSSFRPQTKQHMLQQRPQSPQHQQQQQQQSPSVAQNQLQISSSQQHQKQHHQQQKQLQQHQQLQQQNISMPHHLPDLHSNKNQQSLQQQHLQASRSHASITQRSNNQSGQPVLLHPGITSPITEGTPETCNRILSKRSIQELVAQIDPHEKLEPEVEDVLVEIADDFVESITKAACSLAKHRRSTTLEAKDILLHVERNWNITLPGFGGDEVKLYKKPYTNDIHKERLAMIRKSIGIASDSGITKNVGSGHAAVNSKTHASRASAPAASSPKAS